MKSQPLPVVPRNLYNKKLLWDFLKTYFFTLCRNSTMHGAFHVGDTRNPTIVRWAWAILIALAWTMGITCATTFLKRYNNRPTVIAIEKDYMNWYTIFPTITFCPHHRINETALELFLKKSNPKNATKLEMFLRNLANLTLNNLYISSFQADYPEITSDDYLKILDKILNNFDNKVFTISGQFYPLRRVITELGFCSIFNSNIYRILSTDFIISDHWPQEGQSIFKAHYLDGIQTEPYAQIVGMNGTSDIYWHSPNDMPSSSNLIKVDEKSFSYITLRFTSMTLGAKKSIRNLCVHQRKCRFLDESNLPHFPQSYSENLCKIEARVQKMLNFCKCLPIFYKRLPWENYCNPIGLRCIHNHRVFIENYTKNYDCLPNCEKTRFFLESSDFMLWFRGNIIRWELINPKIRYKREVIYGKANVLTAIGATFALFLGVSLISFIECPFFYFMHIFWSYKSHY